MTAHSAGDVAGAQATTHGFPRPRGRNMRWLIVAVITLLAITNYIDRGNLSVAIPFINKTLGVGPAVDGVILSAFVWPYSVMNLPAGWAVDRLGPRFMMTVAVGAWSVVSILTGMMRAVTGFVVLRVLLGVSEAPMFPAAVKAADAWFPRAEKGRAISVFIAGTQVGLAVAGPLSTVLIFAIGWPAMFAVTGVIGLVVLVGWIALYRRPEGQARLSAAELAYIQATRTRQPARSADYDRDVRGRAWAGLFAYPAMWAMMIGNFALQYLFWFYITWLPSYLEKAQHFTIGKAGFLAALPYIAGTIGVLLGGSISDLLIRRGATRLDGRRYTIALGSGLTGAVLLATAFSTGAALAVTLLTIGMFTYSLSSAPIWTLATDVTDSPRYVGSVGSIQNFGGFLGGACAPLVTGFLVASSGGFRFALALTAALALISALTYGVVLRRGLPV